jgi:hypothetical protein
LASPTPLGYDVISERWPTDIITTPMHRFRLLLAVTALVAGCATDNPSDVARDGTGPLLGLDSDRHQAPWADWRAAPGRSVPADISESMTRFDGWRIASRDVVEEAWRGVFPVLDRLARGGASPTKRAPNDHDPYWSALHLLEPGATRQPNVVMEATYLVRPSDYQGEPREGLAVRFYRDIDIDGASATAASATIWMTRRPSAPRTPDQITIWIQTGFAQTGAATVVFERVASDQPTPDDQSNNWRVRTMAPNIVGPTWRPTSNDDAGNRSTRKKQLSLVPSILIDNLWMPHVGPSYAASNRTPADAPEPRPPMAPFLGLSREGRGIDRVYSGSVFPPRPPELGGDN